MAYTAWSVVFGETPTAAKWNQLGTNDAGLRDGSLLLLENEQGLTVKKLDATPVSAIKKNASDQTEIGENDVRATRFVPALPRVEILNINPGDALWHDLDVSAATSARAFMICGSCHFRDLGAGGYNLYVRKNGSAEAAGNLTNIMATGGIAGGQQGGFQVELDTSQIFEWSVSNALADELRLILSGYWEYVD